MAASSSSSRPPPPPPDAAKIRRVEQAAAGFTAPQLFPAGNPYAEALAAHQKAPLALDAAALVGRDRERSPPRGDRRPLATRNKSREDRAAAGGAEGTYGQIREKALGARSKTVPAEIFIGEVPKRSKAVPPNQNALNRRTTRTAAVKREASKPAEDARVRPRGGPANAERAVLRQRLGRLYADRTRADKPRSTDVKKSKTYSPEISRAASARPEDKYGVRRRAWARTKDPRPSRSRERKRVGAAA